MHRGMEVVEPGGPSDPERSGKVAVTGGVTGRMAVLQCCAKEVRFLSLMWAALAAH